MLIFNKYKPLPQATQSNEEYLGTQIWQLKHVFFNEMSAIKNSTLKYLAFSKPFAEAFKLDDSILDKSRPILSSIDQEIEQQEQHIIINQLRNDSIYQSEKPNIDMYLMRKRPLTNPSTGDCVGILILAAKLDIGKERRVILRHFLGKQVPIGSTLPTSEFTQKQQQILTCILLGFQQRKDIAKILENMTNDNYNEIFIKNQLQTLYQKYNCTSLNELVDAVVSNYKNIGQFPGANLNEEVYNLK
ncbi:MAG: hypothetical protein K2Y14_06165 [Burkholderiales bacterium]|nr:hypothetical protein [Burkholderiales bacterium]